MIRLEVLRGSAEPRVYEWTRDARIGRAEGNDLVLGDGHVSGEHARLMARGAAWVLVDLGSTNGTFVVRGGVRTAVDDAVKRELELMSGDVIELGAQDRLVEMRVSLVSEVEDARVFAVRKIAELVPAATIVEKEGAPEAVAAETKTKSG